MEYKDNYLPVDPDFIDDVNKIATKALSGKIHYFDPRGKVDDVQGIVQKIEQKGHVEFVKVDTGELIRMDKIITIMGKPGPSYSEYERFANACLSCENLELP